MRYWSLLALTVAACGGGETTSPPPAPPPPPVVASVLVSPPTAQIPVGGTATFTAQALTATGALVSGKAFAWVSNNTTVATVSASGLVTAQGIGNATISASTDGIAATAAVQVLPVPLEIHQINVGWGGSVFVRGPSGVRILLEAGENGRGTADVVPYLAANGAPASAGLDYIIAGHQHCDHVGGLDEVLAAGYGIRFKSYFNGSSETSSCVTAWQAAAAGKGRPVEVPPVGTVLQLGDGAKLTVIAVNGSLIGGGTVAVSDENDRSIAILIQYGGFDYFWGSDLGGGDADGACTGRSTGQKDLESPLITAISPGGASPLVNAAGVDVVVVNHHGSESSMNSTFMNRARPQVAIIGTGSGQASNYMFPRKSVVESVLLAGATSCVTAPPALVLQSEEGSPTGTETSFAGFSVGDIKISTTGVSTFTVSASGRVHGGPVEGAAAGLPRTFTFDRAPAGSLAAYLEAVRPGRMP